MPLTNAQCRSWLNKNSGEAAKTITGATNATPIVITATAHGYQTGDKVCRYNVGGNTAANGYGAITRVDADTFEIDGSVGNGAYTSGGSAVRVVNDLTRNDVTDILDAFNRVSHAPADKVSAAFPHAGPNP